MEDDLERETPIAEVQYNCILQRTTQEKEVKIIPLTSNYLPNCTTFI
jgi:hypothetical protein